MTSMLNLQTRINQARGVTATRMPQSQLDQLQAVEVHTFVTGNTTNVWLMHRDIGTGQRGPYDKWRVTQYWYDSRNGVWQKGNSTLSVNWGDRDSALYALNALAVVMLTPALEPA